MGADGAELPACLPLRSPPWVGSCSRCRTARRSSRRCRATCEPRSRERAPGSRPGHRAGHRIVFAPRAHHPPHLRRPLRAAAPAASVGRACSTSSRARKPDLVVLSGDLTQRAKPRAVPQARAFVDSIPVPIAGRARQSRRPALPGLGADLRPLRRLPEVLRPELEPVYRDDELLVVGRQHRLRLDAQGRPHPRSPPARGGASSSSRPAGASSRWWWPTTTSSRRPTSARQRVLANAYEAIDLFSAAGVDLILSGHLHQAYIGNSEEFYPRGRPPVVILHSGTTTSSRGRGSERETQHLATGSRIDEDSMRSPTITGTTSSAASPSTAATGIRATRAGCPACWRRLSVGGDRGELNRSEVSSARSPRPPAGDRHGRAMGSRRGVGQRGEAELMAGFLESRGIPCQLESLLFHQPSR